MGKEEEFKVVDRRASAGASDSPEPEKPGPGFVMKDSKEAETDRVEGVDFSTFVFSLATGAFIHMGLAPDPTNGKTSVNLPLAQQNIDLLILLREKTKGNLSEQENSMLEGLLSEAQLHFVQVSKQR